MPQGDKRKNKKQYYHGNKKARRQSVLAEGMKGFLLTCNNRERECVNEAYNVLNEYADKLYSTKSGDVEKSEEDSSDDDIEAALEKEKLKLNKERDKKSNERRFQVVESGAKNCVFIKTTLDNPGEIMENIVGDIWETKKQKSRFILR